MVFPKKIEMFCGGGVLLVTTTVGTRVFVLHVFTSFENNNLKFVEA